MPCVFCMSLQPRFASTTSANHILVHADLMKSCRGWEHAVLGVWLVALLETSRASMDPSITALGPFVDGRRKDARGSDTLVSSSVEARQDKIIACPHSSWCLWCIIFFGVGSSWSRPVSLQWWRGKQGWGLLGEFKSDISNTWIRPPSMNGTTSLRFARWIEKFARSHDPVILNECDNSRFRVTALGEFIR